MCQHPARRVKKRNAKRGGFLRVVHPINLDAKSPRDIGVDWRFRTLSPDAGCDARARLPTAPDSAIVACEAGEGLWLTRTSRILKGTLTSYVNQAVALLVGLWMSRYLTEVLGRDAFGHWVVVGKVLALVGLADVGIFAILPRDLAMALGRAKTDGDITQSQELIAITRGLVRVQMPLMVGIAMCAWIYAQRHAPEVSGPLGIILATFVVTFPARIYTSVLLATQEMAVLGVNDLSAFIINTAVTVLLVFLGMGFWALGIGWISGTLTNCGLAVMQVHRRHRSLLSGQVQFTWRGAKSLLGRSIWPSIGQIVHLAIFAGDVLLIGLLCGPAAVAIFAFTSKLYSVFEITAQTILHQSGPAIAEIRGMGDQIKLRRAWIAIGQATWIIATVVCGTVLATSRDFVTFWVGIDNFGGMPMAFAVGAATTARLWSLGLIFPLFFSGHERAVSLAGTASGVLTLVAIGGLVKVYGPIGAPLGSVIGSLSVLPLYWSWSASVLGETRLRFLRTLTLPMSAWVLANVGAWYIGLWRPDWGHATLLFPLKAALGGCLAVTLCWLVLPRLTLHQYVGAVQERLRSRFLKQWKAN